MLGGFGAAFAFTGDHSRIATKRFQEIGLHCGIVELNCMRAFGIKLGLEKSAPGNSTRVNELLVSST